MYKKVLIYSQDVGGAKYIAPVINTIVAKYQVLVIAHSLSESIFLKEKIIFSPLTNFFNKSHPSKYAIESFLIKNNISHLFCTTSSPYLDLTNSRLINVCRALKIPTFGIMDHWKGYDRFFDDKGETSYFPDYVGCIDKACKEKLVKFGNNPERIFVVGHPHLEGILSKRELTKEKNKVINIIIISQPDTKSRSFNSIFMKEIEAESVIENIIKQIKHIKNGIDVNINYRIHPKEQASSLLPDGINVNKTEDWQDALRNNDIFIGLDSMLLIEAGLAGKHCISLRIPEFSCFIDTIPPYRVGEEVEDIDNLGNTIIEVVKMIQNGKHYKHSDLEETVRDSLKRLIHYFEIFVNDATK